MENNYESQKKDFAAQDSKNEAINLLWLNISRTENSDSAPQNRTFDFGNYVPDWILFESNPKLISENRK